MRFILAFAVSLFVALICTDQLKKAPTVFYLLSIAAVAIYVYGISQGPAVGFWGFFIPFMQRCTLAMAFFAIVMFVGVFDENSPIRKKLMPVRRQLSICGCLLCLAHVFYYAKTYLAQLGNSPQLQFSDASGNLILSHYFRNPRSSARRPRHHVLHLCEGENEGLLVEEYPTTIVRILHAHHRTLGNNPRAACTFRQHASHRERRCVGTRVRLICGAENQKRNQTAPSDRYGIAYEGSLSIPQRRALSAKHLHRASRMPHLTSMKFQRIKAYRATSAA